MIVSHDQTELRVHPERRKSRSRETKMIQLNSTGKILDDVPRNSTMRLSAIVKGYLITKFPNAIQNRLNKIDNNRTIPRNTGHETKKENRNAIWNKRPRRRQKRREQRNKESTNNSKNNDRLSPCMDRMRIYQTECSPNCTKTHEPYRL